MSDDRQSSEPPSAEPTHDEASASSHDRSEVRAEVPPWARGFPNDPELQRLLSAFEQGRYDVVRAGAPKLAAATGNPKVAAAAQELQRRLRADPLAIMLLVGAFALLALLSAWAYLHQHP